MASGSITGSVKPAPIPVSKVSGRICFPVPGICPGGQKSVVIRVENVAFFPLYRFFRASPLGLSSLTLRGTQREKSIFFYPK